MHSQYGSVPTTVPVTSTTATVEVTPPASHPYTGSDVVGLSIFAVAAILVGTVLFRVFGRRS